MTERPRTLDQDFEEDFGYALSQGLELSDRDEYSTLWHDNRPMAAKDPMLLIRIAKTLRPSTLLDDVRSGVDPSLPPLAGLDAEGRELDRRVRADLQERGGLYFAALARVTRQASYAALDEVGNSMLPPDVDPQGQARDSSARATARSLAIGYLSALDLNELDGTIDAVTADDGHSHVPWLDSRPLATPPRPWSDEDWERDRRRATAGGMHLAREEWEVAAEEGRDIVSEQLKADRKSELARLGQDRAALLQSAQETEAVRRRSAIEEELRRRATERLGPRTAR